MRPVQTRGVEKTDCRELLEVHRNVIDVKSIAFLMILLAPEVSFVTLHMRWHKGCCSNSIHNKNKRKAKHDSRTPTAAHLTRSLKNLKPHSFKSFALTETLRNI